MCAAITCRGGFRERDNCHIRGWEERTQGFSPVANNGKCTILCQSLQGITIHVCVLVVTGGGVGGGWEGGGWLEKGMTVIRVAGKIMRRYFPSS